MADLYIIGVRKRPEEALLQKAQVFNGAHFEQHIEPGIQTVTRERNGIEISRMDLLHYLQSIDPAISFRIATQDGDGKWIAGDWVFLDTVDGAYYVKTAKNGIAADDLSMLPLF